MAAGLPLSTKNENKQMKNKQSQLQQNQMLQKILAVLAEQKNTKTIILQSISKL